VTVVPKLKAMGPLPLSEVQIRLSLAANPAPVQLHGVALHLTATTLPVALNAPVIPMLPAEVAPKLAGIAA
jgi:hypothetical protein